MRLLQRPSPWRSLFAGESLPDPAGWPALLAPLGDALTTLGPEPGLAEAKAWQPTLVEALVRLDVPAPLIAELLSAHNDWLYRRAIDDAQAEMHAQGWGRPPVAFCVITLGSGARHESLLGPDQDNAMILDTYPDARHTEIDGYFQELAGRFTDTLDAAGIPLCRGHVMARWPLWRKRLEEWGRQLEIWTAERRVKRVQQATILLDFAPVYGEARLAEALTDRALALVPRAALFLDEMAELLDESPPVLERFGRLVVDDEAPHERAFNLKRRGLLPLVNATRLLAWCHGCRGVDTRGRLAELVVREGLKAPRAQALQAAFERCQALLLRAQRESLAQGRSADGWIDMARLDEAERLLLRHDLGLVRELIKRAKAAARSGRRR